MTRNLLAAGLSVHAFIEALLATAKKRCAASETLIESFQRLVCACHSALEDDRRRAALQPRLAARKRFPPTLSGRRSADVAASPATGLASTAAAAGRRQTQRSASSGAVVRSGGGGGERANSLQRIDYKRFSPDSDRSTVQPLRRRTFVSGKNDCVKVEH